MRVRPGLVASVTVAVGWLTSVATALAASPEPSAVVGGDPRSAGQGPGLVGDPAFAVLTVVAIGFGAVVLTLAYLRLTAPHRG